MLDKYVPCDNSQTVKILNWEPMPWEQAFIEHANPLRQLRIKPIMEKVLVTGGSCT